MKFVMPWIVIVSNAPLQFNNLETFLTKYKCMNIEYFIEFLTFLFTFKKRKRYGLNINPVSRM